MAALGRAAKLSRGLLPLTGLLASPGLCYTAADVGQARNLTQFMEALLLVGYLPMATLEALLLRLRAVCCDTHDWVVQLELLPPPSTLAAVEACPPLLWRCLHDMLAQDNLTAPTFELHIQALREGEGAGAAVAWRVKLHSMANDALLALQGGNSNCPCVAQAPLTLRLTVAKLVASARPLETHILALATGQGGRVVQVHPAYVATVHAGKPPDRHAFDPVPRHGAGAHVKGKDAGKAALKTLPSMPALKHLASSRLGRRLLEATKMRLGPLDLSERGEGLGSFIPRPSRFAILLMFYEVHTCMHACMHLIT